ncbi:hypothetical protein R1sor_020494 [Riccia sorocarpa]|uniref:PGG domain-containing protein n=1 Tax=Riccia sorocarpa TaxID=122646 RepID=A0ABD3IIB9_9MARC
MANDLLCLAVFSGDLERVTSLLLQDGIDVNMKAGEAQLAPLHHAVEKNFVEIAELLLQHREIDVNAQDSSLRTPLHLACRNGFTEIVAMLLNKDKIYVNARAKGDITPLHLACRNGFTEIVAMLLKYKEKIYINNKIYYINKIYVSARAKGGITPLHLAAFCNNDKVVSLLLEHCDLLCYERDEEGMTALHMAAFSGSDSIVKMILDELGSDTARGLSEVINGIDKFGRTALHYAAGELRLDVVKELFKSPLVHVNTGDQNSFTALHLATRKGHVAMVQLLLNHPEIDPNKTAESNEATLEFAESIQESSVWEELPRPRLTDYIFSEICSKITALHLALEFVEEEFDSENDSMALMKGYGPLGVMEGLVVKELKKLKALLAIGVMEGGEMEGLVKELKEFKALFAIGVMEELVKALLAHPNTDVTIENDKGQSPIDLAMQKKFDLAMQKKLEPVLVMLIRKSNDILSLCEKLYTSYLWNKPYQSMISAVNKEIDAHLNSLNLRIGTRRYYGSLIHKLALAGYDKLLTVLLSHPELFDVNIEDSDNQTPLHIATIAGQTTIVKVLIGIPELKFNHEDRFNRTALQIAVMKKREDIKNLLLGRPEVKDWIDRLYRDRQVFVDAANPILVGAALIAGVTYAGLLQPPLGYTPYYEYSVPDPAPPDTYEVFAAVKQHMSVRAFWACNSLSFFFAIATVISGAGAVLPKFDRFISEEVRVLRKYLLRTSVLLVFAVSFVLGAFVAAGFASLPPAFSLEIYMVITSVIGGLTCRHFIPLNVRKSWQSSCAVEHETTNEQ